MRVVTAAQGRRWLCRSTSAPRSLTLGTAYPRGQRGNIPSSPVAWSPALEPSFHPAEDPRHYEAGGGDDDDADHDLVGLEPRTGNRDEIAEPLGRAEHLTDHDADETMAEAQAQAREQQRHRGRH